MPRSFEKEFISFCKIQDLEINKNQITVIKKLEQYYQNNFKYFFSKFFLKQSSKRGLKSLSYQPLHHHINKILF